MSDILIYAIGISLAVAAVRWLYKRRQFDTPEKISEELMQLKDAEVNFPGHMAFANKGGELFHGCRVAMFKNVSDLNHFFEPGNPGHLKLVGELMLQTDGSILCVYTAKLSNEDLEDVEEWNRNQHEYFQQKKRARHEEKLAAQEKELAEAKEEKRLAEVGRKHEANCKKG